MKQTATQRLLDLVRASVEPPTDYQVAKVMQVTRSTVSAWRTGKGHMSMANVSRACDLAGIPQQTWEWQIRVGAEREKTAEGDIYREALKDLESYRASGEPSPNGLFALLTRGGRAAAIVAPVLMVLLGAFSPEKPASAAPIVPVNRAVLDIDYAMSWVRRIRRAWRRRFLTWFPASSFRLQGAAA